MKNLFRWALPILALLATGLFSPRAARAQFEGFVSPQSANQAVFNAVTVPILTPNANPGTNPFCAPAVGAACAIPNQGQNFHLLTYTTSGSSGPTAYVQLRLEASNDGVNFFPISDDATDPLSGEVVAFGQWPVVRANLLAINLGVGATLTAQYSGTWGAHGPPLGVYNPSQFAKKVLFSQVPANANASVNSIPAVFGSTAGYLVVRVNGSGTTASGSNLVVTGQFGDYVTTQTISLSALTVQIYSFPFISSPASTISFAFNTGGASTATISAYAIFVSPSLTNGLIGAGIESPTTFNAEVVSATNAAAVQNFGNQISLLQRDHLYSVSARCSAGTGQLTVSDGGTQIWSTAATEVGTTTFKFQWNPGLAGSLGKVMVVTLSTCGSGNTGTLDVQGSQF